MSQATSGDGWTIDNTVLQAIPKPLEEVDLDDGTLIAQQARNKIIWERWGAWEYWVSAICLRVPPMKDVRNVLIISEGGPMPLIEYLNGVLEGRKIYLLSTEDPFPAKGKYHILHQGWRRKDNLSAIPVAELREMDLIIILAYASGSIERLKKLLIPFSNGFKGATQILVCPNSISLPLEPLKTTPYVLKFSPDLMYPPDGTKPSSPAPLPGDDRPIFKVHLLSYGEGESTVAIKGKR